MDPQTVERAIKRCIDISCRTSLTRTFLAESPVDSPYVRRGRAIPDPSVAHAGPVEIDRIASSSAIAQPRSRRPRLPSRRPPHQE